MPELAEVEFYRKRWQSAGAGRIAQVAVNPKARVFRSGEASRLAQALPGQRLLGSETSGKQMLFRFSGGNWLGVHLGMSGELRADVRDYAPARHDHLVIFGLRRALVFNDPRTFGRIRFDQGTEQPAWWRALAPAVLSSAFTLEAVEAFLRRRARAPIKAVLLMQERFPGVGNWMADEILWRAGIHPRQPAGSLRPAERKALWRECRRVCRLALIAVAGRGPVPPADYHGRIPKSWLLPHRWEDGGHCPRTGVLLARATIGGRTTCWSPALQKFHG